MKKTSGAISTTAENLNNKQHQNDSSNEKLEELRLKLKNLYYSADLKNAKIREIQMKGFSNKGSESEIIPSYIILPLSSKKITWDICLSILIIAECLFIPLDFGFGKECFISEEGNSVLFVIQSVSYVIFGLDMLFTFFTALENEKAEYEYNLKKIAIHYFKTFFVFDAISNLPIEYMIEFDQEYCWKPNISISKVFLLFRFIRVVKLIKINNVIEKYTPASLVSVVRLVKIICFYFFIIHIVGVIFMANSNTLLERIPPNYKDTKSLTNFATIYTFAIFVGIYLILGSDMAYKSSSEKAFIVFINIVALIVNANIFGYIAVTLKNSSLGGGEESNLERIDSINDFLNYQQVDNKLKHDIKNYYLLMYKRQRDLFYGNDIFDDLSKTLKIISNFEYWKGVYFSYDTFFIKCSSSFFADSLLVMRAKMFLANERVIHEGESSMDFYLIPSGGKCIVKVQGVTVKVLKEGEYFGETATFLTSQKRSASVDSVNLSDLLYIKGEDFITLLRNYNEEAEMLKSIAMSNFYNTIGLTRISLATQFFPKNPKNSLFKKNLYDNNDEEPPVIK
jgi:hypothetical protein